MADRRETDKVREQYADEPGVGGQVEQYLGQRENTEAYGGDTGPIDQTLKDLGYPNRKTAARKRATAANAAVEPAPGSQPEPGEGPSADAKAQQPQGRTAPRDKQAKAGGE